MCIVCATKQSVEKLILWCILIFGLRHRCRKLELCARRRCSFICKYCKVWGKGSEGVSWHGIFVPKWSVQCRPPRCCPSAKVQWRGATSVGKLLLLGRLLELEYVSRQREQHRLVSSSHNPPTHPFDRSASFYILSVPHGG